MGCVNVKEAVRKRSESRAAAKAAKEDAKAQASADKTKSSDKVQSSEESTSKGAAASVQPSASKDGSLNHLSNASRSDSPRKTWNGTPAGGLKSANGIPLGTYAQGKKAQKEKDTRRSRLSLEPEDEEEPIEPADVRPYLPADSQSVLSMLSESESKAQYHDGTMIVASVSRKGYVPYSKQPNQDRELVHFNVQQDPDMVLMAVMDGHGKFGHRVADYVKANLVRHLENQVDLKRDPKTSITKAVKDLADELQAKKPIDMSFSGTTALVVLKIKNNLFVANIGDARAVVCVESVPPNGGPARVEGFPISQEHSPYNEVEAARIKKAGGRIKCMTVGQGEDPGPLRVWLKETEAPGLTMTRAIGDEVAQTVGVIAVPQIWQYEIQDTDVILVLGTDGLFKFMSNDDVCKIAYQHKESLVVACKLLTREARERWKEREEISDDITMVIADLRPSSAAALAAYKAQVAAQGAGNSGVASGSGSAQSLQSSGSYTGLKSSRSTETQPQRGQLGNRSTIK